MKLRLPALIGLLLLGATAAADTAVYELDPKNATEITRAFNSVLAAQCQQPSIGANPNACRAELLPTGQLLVTAPDAVQAQVAAALKAIAARNVTPTPRVTLQYWVIYGEARKPDAADAALKQLDSVVQQLKRTHGDLGFSVLDSAALTTQSGASASTGGGALQISESVRANADSVNVALQLSFSPKRVTAAAGADAAAEAAAAAAIVSQSLNLQVTILRGEYLVLGERTAGGPDKSGKLFFVVHWPQAQ